MPTPKVKAQLRENIGGNKVSKLRNQGFVPGVVYGHNKETREVKVEVSELRKLINRYGTGTMINIDLDGELVLALVKDVQKDMLKGHLLHVDFQQLSEDETVRLTVPITIEGKDKVEDNDTIVQQQVMELNIECLPKDIPSTIVVDAGVLKSGDALTVGDLDIAKNEDINVLDETGEVIASLTTASTIVELEEEDEKEAGEVEEIGKEEQEEEE